MLNGVRVAAAQSLGAQLSACTIMFQAGSRLERDNQLGASHFVRAMSGCSGHAYSLVGKARVLQQRGCYLTCSSDRQTLAFTLRCPFPHFHDLKYFLVDTATRCCFHEWEVSDIKPFIKDNLLRMSSEQRALDLVQKAFWAGPLHQSMFCDEARVDSMSSANLKDFVTNFTPSNCIVTSCGIPFEDTLKLAEGLHLQCDVCCEQEHMFSFPRGGYEWHDLGSGSDTCVAAALLGCGTQDLCCLMKHSILAATWDVLFAQLREGALDRIVRDQTPLGCQTDELYPTYKPFSISYMETGVFGVLAKSHSSNANKVANTAAQLLANVDKLSVEHIDYGKKRLKLNLSINEENCVNISESLGLQMASKVHIDAPLNAYCVIDSIPNEEVLQLAKDIVSRNLRRINVATALNTLKEFKSPPKYISKESIVSNCKIITFSPRSIGFGIEDKPSISRVKQDPLSYIPIINPRSILPIIDTNWRKDEIGLPAIRQEEKQAVRLIVIRRKKMKKHQRNKLWKRMRHRWARIKKRRRQIKEKIFQNELLAMVKAANEFSAEQYVASKIESANHTPLPTRWRHKRLPAFIIRQLLGIDKKINYKHTDVYKA
ncbi:Cytochrome b-c1 complex subunit 2, mitochondrial [Papilio machaon]|uniref:Cytochrome b-c1 complex subunit 2, mitochondrial n=1 Tax=Papilio machaon TaxID=76193 RepID=A0A194RM54_PAPMA|nr:Cytochrome b-c1 complex subunit 2, mitochondrial [Papilio machaon]